jgi:pSer/pThr/pTyr-binding forkhead associated (FHA) protein
MTRRELTRRLTLVGRQRPSALRIADRDISALHAILYWQSGTIWAIDLLSRTGTRLQDTLIDAAEFSPGSSLMLGQASVTLVPSSTPGEGAHRAVARSREARDVAAEEERLAFRATCAAWEQRRLAIDRKQAEVAAQQTAREAELTHRAAELDEQWSRLRLDRERSSAEIDQQRAMRLAEVQAASESLVLEETRLVELRSQLDSLQQAIHERQAEVEAAAQTLEDRLRAREMEVADQATALASERAHVEGQLRNLIAERTRLDAEREELERAKAVVAGCQTIESLLPDEAAPDAQASHTNVLEPEPAPIPPASVSPAVCDEPTAGNGEAKVLSAHELLDRKRSQEAREAYPLPRDDMVFRLAQVTQEKNRWWRRMARALSHLGAREDSVDPETQDHQ